MKKVISLAPLNGKLEDNEIIAVTVVVCGFGEEDFDSLTSELQRSIAKFADADALIKMSAMPIIPKDKMKVGNVKQKVIESEIEIL